MRACLARMLQKTNAKHGDVLQAGVAMLFDTLPTPILGLPATV